LAAGGFLATLHCLSCGPNDRETAERTDSKFESGTLLRKGATGNPPKKGNRKTQSIADFSHIVLSEVCAINKTGLRDENGEHSDWIEIHNRSDHPIRLKGLFLTDSKKKKNRWAFPDRLLEGYQFLVVHASGRNQTASAYGPLHTDFKLSGDGEYLALRSERGLVDKLTFPQQFPDLSFGRSENGIGHLESPTPGSPNAKLIPTGGPTITNVQHQLTPDRGSGQLRVTATVESESSPAEVFLHYRVLFGKEKTLTMNWEEATASAVVPAGSLFREGLRPGGLLRFYVTAGSQGQPGRSRSPNLLSTHGSRYHGAVLAPAAASSLPTLHWFTENPATAASREGTRCALVFKGTYFDNVYCRIRGATSIRWDKQSFKFRFPEGREFPLTDDSVPVSEFNLNTTVQDKAYLREALAYEVYQRCGVPSPRAYNVRVQLNGRFYGVSTLVEQIDEAFLSQNQFSAGGLLYKAMDSREEIMEIDQKSPKKADEAHLELFAILRGARSTEEKERLLFDRIDIPAMVNYLAAGTVIRDWDRPFHNYYLYRNGPDRKWTMFPWDKDLTLGEVWRSDWISGEGQFGHPFYGSLGEGKEYNVIFDLLFSHPGTRAMYLRRLRTLMDQFLQPETTPLADRWFEKRIDELAERLARDAEEDLEAWGSAVVPSQPRLISFPEAIQDLKGVFLTERRSHLYETHGPGSETGIPPRQKAWKSIAENIALVWDHERQTLVIENRSKMAIDLSATRLSDPVNHRFKPGTVLAPGGQTGSRLHLGSGPTPSRTPRDRPLYFQQVRGGNSEIWNEELQAVIRLSPTTS
ncbi:MAG: CotH kinase family protein, partial [Verrucomicrobiota bacterium]